MSSRKMAQLIKGGGYVSPRDVSPRKVQQQLGETGPIPTNTAYPRREASPRKYGKAAQQSADSPLVSASVSSFSPAPVLASEESYEPVKKESTFSRPAPAVSRTDAPKKFSDYEQPAVKSYANLEPSIESQVADLQITSETDNTRESMSAPVNVVGATAQRLALAHSNSLSASISEEVDENEWLDKASDFSHSAQY